MVGWGQTTVTWPGTSALPGSATAVGNDQNVTIMVSAPNSYSNPIRIYANTTVTIDATNDAKILSVAYEASSTGNYVTYAQNATVSPQATPTVSGKIVTWTYAESANVTHFTFTPSSQTRSNGISITYKTAGGGSQLTPSDLALTNAPVALTFDLYNNNAAQTISYTTSGTGNVSVSSSNYVTTQVNQVNKTITVTPNAVTPSAQTITVSQAADGTYDAGQVTFTVEVDDSTPGADVTFTAGTDSGTNSDYNNSDEMSKSGVTIWYKCCFRSKSISHLCEFNDDYFSSRLYHQQDCL